MVRLHHLGTSDHPLFTYRTVNGMSLLYHIGRGNLLQLVIPNTLGLRPMLMSELHCTATSAHLGTRKTIWNLMQRVWWPRLA